MLDTIAWLFRVWRANLISRKILVFEHENSDCVCLLVANVRIPIVMRVEVFRIFYVSEMPYFALVVLCECSIVIFVLSVGVVFQISKPNIIGLVNKQTAVAI